MAGADHRRRLTVWSIRGAIRPPNDQTLGRLSGLLGAAIGLVLSGALVTALERLEDNEPGPLMFLVWLVLYPIGSVVGYDLAVGGGLLVDHGPMVRVGAYGAALAGAHVAIAGGLAVCVGFGVDGDSPAFAVAYALCVVGAFLGRTIAARLATGFSVPPAALIGGAAITLLLALFADAAAFGAYLSRIDS